ncbi:hypothetical protein G6F46_014120 [Rhizopus delemar]|uniref:Uncharacterized protein n=1 Tax=Rhizopus delemar TaxID=936053 RepID=A0A9P6XP75_9FUNG|nr:hypothetical protein G6F50_017829 [Rhizopus delemar]KAG1599148.1 hypothetical protein G6F46_014120 [Rhizopus delemar]
MQVQRERLALERFEGGTAVVVGGLAIVAGAGRFGKRAPVAAQRGGRQGLFQQGLMAFEEFLGHCVSPMN